MSFTPISVLKEQKENPPIPPFQLFRLSKVAHLVGVSKRTIQRWIAVGYFPSPYKIGPSTVAWRADEIQMWIESRPRKQNQSSERLLEGSDV